MFINFHRTMAFMKEMLTFSCYNHFNLLIMINASWKLWWLLNHAEAGTKKRQIRLKHFFVNLLVKIVGLYMLNICL